MTATAETDVAEIWQYIAQDNPAAASAFIPRLEDQIDTLEHSPARRPRVPESRLRGERYRHLRLDHYRAIFKIAGERVIVLRVLHGARLLDTKILDGLAR